MQLPGICRGFLHLVAFTGITPMEPLRSSRIPLYREKTTQTPNRAKLILFLSKIAQIGPFREGIFPSEVQWPPRRPAPTSGPLIPPAGRTLDQRGPPEEAPIALLQKVAAAHATSGFSAPRGPKLGSAAPGSSPPAYVGGKQPIAHRQMRPPLTLRERDHRVKGVPEFATTAPFPEGVLGHSVPS